MSNLKEYIEPLKGFFWGMNQANSDRYEDIFGSYDGSLDMYFYFLYGFRPSSNLMQFSSLENIGDILFIRYYPKWKSLYDDLATAKAQDIEKSETNNAKVTYESNGTNSNTTNDVNKVFGFDSEDGKTDTTSDTKNEGTNTNEYTQTTEQYKGKTQDALNNIRKRLKLLTDYDFLNIVINDILTTVSQSVYNEDED